jgi:hypothetical protein
MVEEISLKQYLGEKIDSFKKESSDKIDSLKEDNTKEHSEIIKHQVHTNGTITDIEKREIKRDTSIKVWRVAGGLALTICLALFSFVSTFYFVERGEQRAERQEQNKKFEQMIRIQEQVDNISKELKYLKLTDYKDDENN